MANRLRRNPTLKHYDLDLVAHFQTYTGEDEMLQACGLELMKRIDDTRDPGPVCRAFIMASVIVLRELFGHQFTIDKLQDLIDQLMDDLSERH